MIKFLNKHSEELFSGKKITYRGKVYWANMTTLEIYAMSKDAFLSGVINGYKVAEIMNDFGDHTWEIVEAANDEE